MAIYEYKCRKCENIITVNHSINDSPTVMCECGAKRIKVFSAPALNFPGSGWGSDR